MGIIQRSLSMLLPSTPTVDANKRGPIHGADICMPHATF